MNWNTLTSEDDLQHALDTSKQKPVLLFKHSTRCSISSMAKDRLERSWQAEDQEQVEPFYLDLIAYRPISKAIADQLGVEHASPQAILVRDGKAVWNASHMSIAYDQLKAEAEAHAP